jgi:hypothetical protein
MPRRLRMLGHPTKSRTVHGPSPCSSSSDVTFSQYSAPIAHFYSRSPKRVNIPLASTASQTRINDLRQNPNVKPGLEVTVYT